MARKQLGDGLGSQFPVELTQDECRDAHKRDLGDALDKVHVEAWVYNGDLGKLTGRVPLNRLYLLSLVLNCLIEEATRLGLLVTQENRLLKQIPLIFIKLIANQLDEILDFLGQTVD